MSLKNLKEKKSTKKVVIVDDFDAICKVANEKKKKQKKPIVNDDIQEIDTVEISKDYDEMKKHYEEMKINYERIENENKQLRITNQKLTAMTPRQKAQYIKQRDEAIYFLQRTADHLGIKKNMREHCKDLF